MSDNAGPPRQNEKGMQSVWIKLSAWRNALTSEIGLASRETSQFLRNQTSYSQYHLYEPSQVVQALSDMLTDENKRVRLTLKGLGTLSSMWTTQCSCTETLWVDIHF